MNVISSPLTDDESTESIDKVAPDIDPLSVHSFTSVHYVYNSFSSVRFSLVLCTAIL